VLQREADTNKELYDGLLQRYKQVSAEAGERVLLIDGDLRRPTLDNLVGVGNSRGFADVLAGTTLSNAAVRSDDFGLDLLPAGNTPESPAALLDVERIREIIAAAQSAYDRVIIDGPPTLSLADASRLAAAAGGTIFVVRNDGVTTEEADYALSRLRSEKIHVIGAVMTMFKSSRFARMYDDGYRRTAVAAS
jgi:Mrp family chromosome partitioning ATPase